MDRVVIAGGKVIDGTGAPAVAADVAIEGDRIVEIGTGLRGDRRVDADGCAVAPGFVDIHTHYDAEVFWDPSLTPSCYHGVTTVVAGNCGFSIAPTRPSDRDLLGRTMEKVEDMDPECLAAGIPWEEFESFPEYLEAVRRRGSALNYSAYIGHTPLRLYVLGPEAADRPATSDEVAAMVALIEEAMEAGAAGFATSMALTHVGADGRPIPSRVAQPEETQALCRAVGRSGRGVIGVNGGEGISFTECYDLQPSFGAPITYTAVLTVPSGAHLKAAEIHRERRARRRGRVAAGLVPSALVLRQPRRTFQPQHEPGVRRAHALLDRRAPRRLRRSRLAAEGARGVGRAQGHPAAVGHLRDHGVDRPSRARRARSSRRSPRSAEPMPSTRCST